MMDAGKGRDQLVRELAELRRRVAKLEESATEHKLSEERAEHLGLVLRAVRNVNQLISKATERDDLIQGACDNLVETRGYESAWIALLDEAGRLTASAGTGLGEGFSTLVERMRRGTLPDCGRRALSRPGTWVVEDPASVCGDCPLSKECAGRGAASVRLEHDGKVYGLASVSVPRNLVVDPEEHELFEEVAGDIAFALRNIEVEEYSQDLREIVGRRTRELQDAQEELVRKEKLAILGQLAGGVSHDLRNPLGAIKNAVYFLNMITEEPAPETRETLDILEREVDACERLISSLLDFARPGLPALRKVDVNTVIRKSLFRTTGSNHIEVASRLGEALPIVLADPDQLGRAFENIILNGLQAMPEGGCLTVRTEVSDSRWIAASISDTGVGIREEDLDKVFEPLFTGKAKGIGLGLAVTRALVEANGGTIDVGSRIGEGSTFTVTLPIAGNRGA